MNGCGPKYFSCIDLSNDLKDDNLSILSALDLITCAKYFKGNSIKKGSSSAVNPPDDIDMWKSPERQRAAKLKTEQEAKDHQNKINKENIEKHKREQELIKRNRDKLGESQ